jgi:outer membrane protein OmpA-like peptidoglycan-associated protein
VGCPADAQHAAAPVRAVAKDASGAPGATAAPALTLQHAVGNRATAALLQRRGRVLARTAAEQQFAVTHEGQVEDVQVFVGGQPQLQPEDIDEFVLWNWLVDSDVVRRGHKAGLDAAARRWATELADNPLLNIRVSGFASVTGTAEHNEDLALRRAEAVRDHLVSLGVPEGQIAVDANGSRLPMDEGTSPESLARNRRVEVSKFFTTTVGTLSDLAPGTEVRLDELDFRANASVALSVENGFATLRFAPQSLRAGGLRVSSIDPAVEVGFLQIITKDTRVAGYSAADADDEVLDVRAPPVAFLDYAHCLDAFTPCRDVELARQPFSVVGRGPNGEARVARPSAAPTDIFFETAPAITLPNAIDLPDGGRAVLTQVAWKMAVQTLVVIRSGGLLVPGGGQAWELALFSSLIAGPDPQQVSRQETDSVAVDSRPIPTDGPFPDIERAMSLPTASLRERMMNQLCQPTLTSSSDSGEFADEMARTQEILRDAVQRVLPDL